MPTSFSIDSYSTYSTLQNFPLIHTPCPIIIPSTKTKSSLAHIAVSLSFTFVTAQLQQYTLYNTETTERAATMARQQQSQTNRRNHLFYALQFLCSLVLSLSPIHLSDNALHRFIFVFSQFRHTHTHPLPSSSSTWRKDKTPKRFGFGIHNINLYRA